MEDSEKEPISEREKGFIRMNRITNYGMGVFIFIFGFVLMFPNRMTAPYLELYDTLLIRFFAVICWLYGGFRIYRGYTAYQRKNK